MVCVVVAAAAAADDDDDDGDAVVVDDDDDDDDDDDGSYCGGCLLDYVFFEGYVRRLRRSTVRSMLCNIALGGAGMAGSLCGAGLGAPSEGCSVANPCAATFRASLSDSIGSPRWYAYRSQSR